jgi:hypothetical protein
LDGWEVSGVTDMSSMFFGAESFNRPLDSWNISSATNSSLMFASAKSFNQPLDMWHVANIVNMAMMFFGASSYRQNLCQWYNASYKSEPNVLHMFEGSNCVDKSDPNFEIKTSFCGTVEQPYCFKSPIVSQLKNQCWIFSFLQHHFMFLSIHF